MVRDSRKLDIALLVAAILFGETAGAIAAESVQAPGPIGGTDIRQAELPPPGLYIAGIGLGGALTDIWDNNSRSSSFTGYGSVVGGALEIVYTPELFGGKFASTVSAGGSEDGAGFHNGKLQHRGGATDTYLDVLEYAKFFPSHYYGEQSPDSHIPYGLNVLASFGLILPTGNYHNDGGIFNVGANTYDLAPNIAATYTMPSIFGSYLPGATEISARTFFSNFTENPATAYQTGQIIDTDFAVSQRIGQIQAGVAGFYFDQVQNDHQFGVVLPNRKAAELAFGPILAYDFIAKDRPFELAVKAEFPVLGRNDATQDLLIIRLSTKLY